MDKFFIGASMLFIPFLIKGQALTAFAGKVIDEQKKGPLQGASISVYKSGRITGTISNKEGRFYITDINNVDSVKISMTGYENIVLPASSLKIKPSADIAMTVSSKELKEIVVRPQSAKDIIKKAIKATAGALPDTNFENNIFYREVIKERERYFSVAEAVFKTQYFIKDKSVKLKMIKGRSKEDVNYTRLFEDFHPGGGPEEAAGQSMSVSFPDFFNLKKLKRFNYKNEPMVEYDGKTFYVISFDQKDDVYEALEKGKIFIDADDFTILRYEAENSPVGMSYIKDLKGTDKLFAQLLNIDFKRKSWARHVQFSKVNGRLALAHADAEYRVGYKQPRKNLDLDLIISTEMVATEILLPMSVEITKSTEWKRKNIVANLPTDYDEDFWGTYNIISPTGEIEKVIAAISKNNNDLPGEKIKVGWQYFQKDLFVAYQRPDSIILIPIIKGAWEEQKAAGMLYKQIEGDFTVETNISITKKSGPDQLPGNGFQQAGLIIRNGNTKEENSIILSVGTGGSSQPKFFLRKTENGKSKGPVDKIDGMNCLLRIEKRGVAVTAFYKNFPDEEWKKITTYHVNSFSEPLQVGLMVMAEFAGSGTKAKPDMKAVFTNFKIISQ